MKQIIKAATVLLLISVGFLLWQRFKLTSFQSTSLMQVEDRSRLLRQVQTAGELTTVKYRFTTQIPVSQTREMVWGAISAESSLLFLAEGTVLSGVDVSQAQLTESGIELPAPKIFAVVLDVERSKVYSADRGWLNLGPDVLDLREVAEAEAVAALRKEACSSGILNRARQQAIVTIAQLTGLEPEQIVIPVGVCQ